MPDTVSDGLFDVPDAPSHGERAPGGSAAAPLAVQCARPVSTRWSGRITCCNRARHLRRLVEGSGVASAILTARSAAARPRWRALISQATGRRFEALSALSAGVKRSARSSTSLRRAAAHGEQTVLFIDEARPALQDPAGRAAVRRGEPGGAAGGGHAPRTRRSPWWRAPLLPVADPGAAAPRRRTPSGRRCAAPSTILRGPGGQVGAAAPTPSSRRCGCRPATRWRALTALEVAAEAGEQRHRRGDRAVAGQGGDPIRPRWRRPLRPVSALIKTIRGSDPTPGFTGWRACSRSGEEPPASSPGDW